MSPNSAATISVEGNHVISVSVLLNSDLDISGAGSLNLSGGISGNHALNVLGGHLTAQSIVVDTLTIGAGGSVTIRETTGVADASAVPEPGTWVLIGIGLLSLLAFRRRRAT